VHAVRSAAVEGGEQLSTAHWFDQRRTREALAWWPAVSLDEGFARLTRWYAEGGPGRS
jgi:nucleoside-diphosphate-sugar epimerase